MHYQALHTLALQLQVGYVTAQGFLFNTENAAAKTTSQKDGQKITK